MDHSWESNYATADNLAIRLESVNNLDSTGRFGFEFLTTADFDNKDAVNLGCGMGNHDQAFFASSPCVPARYLIVDRSAEMVRQAETRLSGIPNLSRLVSDIDSLVPDTIGTFDTAICMHVLYHVPDPELSLYRIAALLKPGGKLLVTTVSHDTNTELIDIHRTVLQSEFGIAMEDPTSWIFDSMNAAGLVSGVFGNCEQHEKIARLHFHDVDSAIRYYRTLPWWSDAAAQGADPDELMAGVANRIGEAIARDGAFSCNKDTVTLIAYQAA